MGQYRLAHWHKKQKPKQREEHKIYRTFLTLKGRIENVESEDWRAWVEYRDCETLILEDVAE